MSNLLDRTVMPAEDTSALSELTDALAVRHAPATLISPDGTRVDLPPELFDLLREAVAAMAAGKAVTIAPHDTVMTTQEAADYLGVSRPTVVKLLEQGMVPFTKPNRHRRVRLADLVEYQERTARQRRQLLDDMTREATAQGVDGEGFEVTR
ncbi:MULTISPECIES: helix-turn-helix domain-containing protein [unclassified Isoptericola]|uniref:helix-turn-helix domain-containing protein n=1 Tax=Isoptericola sp. NPDC056573 TaxID=3345868 RepID=UPI00369C6984